MKIDIENTVTITMAEEDIKFLNEVRHWASKKKNEVWDAGYSVPEDLWNLLNNFQDIASDLLHLTSVTHNLEPSVNHK